MKKTIALLTALIMLIVLSSCNKHVEETTTVPDETITSSHNHTTEKSNYAAQTAILEKTDINSSVTTTVTTEETTASVQASPVPSQWTDDEIIDFYKKAAEKSHPAAKSHQVMVLNELIINNGDGALGFFTKILEPAIRSVVKKNAFDFDGITGGFKNLTSDDVKSIKAYQNGGYTVIEMTMKEQTDPIHADAYEGSVGHAITVLGDISKVLAEFPQFDVDVENADIAVHYVDATVKVKINQNGIIEKGTWKYTCDPEIKNLDISGIMVHTADAKIDYIITVGGGF